MGNNCTPSLKVSSNDETRMLAIDINAKIIEQPLLRPTHSISLSKSLGIEYDRASVSPLPHLTARLSSKSPNGTPLADLVDPFDVDCPDPEPSPVPPMHQTPPVDAQPKISNGITGTHISCKICNIAAKFWQQNIDTLPMEKKTEIACAIFFGAMSANADMKAVMTSTLMHGDDGGGDLKQKSLKFLAMFGWLLQYLMVDGIDLYAILARLGIFHQRMGINIQHFEPLLQSLHDVFGHYFPIKYDIEVKYAFDEIYTLAAQIMTGEDLKASSHLRDISESFATENQIEFLQNLDQCLHSVVGCEYLYRFLKQTFCDELVLFLKAVYKFKTQSSSTPVQRFMIARDIVRVSIESDAEFTLNLSYECRQKVLDSMQSLEQKFAAKEHFTVNVNFFDEVDHEIRKLISVNHW
eukprot:CAMPEP_0202691540 /NCGR_PEP_ID=MMETSP1385-20130828/6232_1 /ASSEMBLY_ACC=CAM_ASM_000861 /TAXON_ID=933848 /ORGANISM="Elphidium margaritaceum" /LENGTH=408 /DNA_ID=CAMNT_0049346967 /DNA_START=52 /DNA_END=1275 /DNA_ORIENTATION=-